MGPFAIGLPAVGAIVVSTGDLIGGWLRGAKPPRWRTYLCLLAVGAIAMAFALLIERP